MQLLAVDLGGVVAPAGRREYGGAQVDVDDAAGIFESIPSEPAVWMSHGDIITELPEGFRAIAHSLNSSCAAFVGLASLRHPVSSRGGPHPGRQQLLANFLIRVCGCAPTWEPGAFVHRAIATSAPGSGRAACSAPSRAGSTRRWPRPSCTEPWAIS